jgi:recombination protein RecA
MISPALRAQLESPFSRRVRETVSTGIAALDSRSGGLPRGAITEIYGSGSSGKTSLMLSILAAAMDRDEACALVDGHDSFSPGNHNGKFLWVRCHDVTQALKSTDLILQGGGFGVVVLDVSDLAAEALQKVSLSTWFRFQRSVEKTPTILTVISQNGIAKTCASLAIHAASDFAFEDRLLTHSITVAEIVRIRSGPKASNVRCNFYPSFSSSIAHP